MSTRNLPALTGIRGLAALWVTLFHVQFFGKAYGADWLIDVPLLRWGWTGVDLFFLLSGFVLMHVHGTQFRTLAPGTIGRFAVLRIFRVYPLATAVLGLILVAVLAAPDYADWYRRSHEPADFTLVSFVRTLTLSTRWFPPFTGDWNQPVWSLSAELVGYCMFPFLALLIGRLEGPRLVVLPLAISTLVLPQVLQPILGARADNDIFGFALVRMAGAFTGGVALYRLHQLTPARWRRRQGSVATVGLVVLILSLLTIIETKLAVLSFGAIVYGIASRRGVVSALLETPVAVFLGRISFPLYLINAPILWFVIYELGKAGTAPAAREVALGAVFLGMLMLATALHYGVERPAQALGRRITQRMVARPPTHATGGTPSATV